MRGFSARELGIVFRLVSGVWPQVRRELSGWRRRLSGRRGELADQARSSLQSKSFHCQGGAVFALMNPPASLSLVPVIVAVQTISDYLDNLCDRTGVVDEACFRRLHAAFQDALSPGARPRNYYAGYPWSDDGGYLASLVRTAQDWLAAMPSYWTVQEPVRVLSGRYVEMQVAKHLEEDRRQHHLRRWVKRDSAYGDRLYWWEYAAAAGSTLGIFALLALAAGETPDRGEVKAVAETYFPWISGLHVLLDYLIDQEEDMREGDLNFVKPYRDRQEMNSRMRLLIAESMKRAGQLPDPEFHCLVIRGLLGLYLSDPKVGLQGLGPSARTLAREARAGDLVFLGRVTRALGLIG